MDIVKYGPMLLKGMLGTLYMTFFSVFLSYLFGLPLGILLYVSKKGGIRPMPIVNRVLSRVINIIRSIPFVILILVLMPISQMIAGTGIGPASAVFALVIGASPLVARMVESSLEELDTGIIEAARTMGCTDLQIILKALIPESLPSLIRGLSVSAVTLLGYSAMAGVVGAGGLGDIAVRYGMHRYNYPVMLVTVIIIVLMVEGIQWAVSNTAVKIDRKNRRI